MYTANNKCFPLIIENHFTDQYIGSKRWDECQGLCVEDDESPSHQHTCLEDQLERHQWQDSLPVPSIKRCADK